jgi:hypothetical protein
VPKTCAEAPRTKASGLHKRVGALWVGAMTLVTLPLGYGSA